MVLAETRQERARIMRVVQPEYIVHRIQSATIFTINQYKLFHKICLARTGLETFVWTRKSLMLHRQLVYSLLPRGEQFVDVCSDTCWKNTVPENAFS